MLTCTPFKQIKWQLNENAGIAKHVEMLNELNWRIWRLNVLHCDKTWNLKVTDAELRFLKKQIVETHC